MRPASKGSYNNGKVDVAAIQSPVVTVDKANVVSALINSGYYTAADFTGLENLSAPAATEAPAAGMPGLAGPAGEFPRESHGWRI